MSMNVFLYSMNAIKVSWCLMCINHVYYSEENQWVIDY